LDWVVSMQVYEIRILPGAPGNGPTLIEASYVSDYSAIRSAQTIANGRGFEVWRGLECIFARNKPAPAFPTDRPAA
jgi:hypothetical protein